VVELFAVRRLSGSPGLMKPGRPCRQERTPHAGQVERAFSIGRFGPGPLGRIRTYFEPLRPRAGHVRVAPSPSRAGASRFDRTQGLLSRTRITPVSLDRAGEATLVADPALREHRASAGKADPFARLVAGLGGSGAPSGSRQRTLCVGDDRGREPTWDVMPHLPLMPQVASVRLARRGVAGPTACTRCILAPRTPNRSGTLAAEPPSPAILGVPPVSPEDDGRIRHASEFGG
jgi:hypothetical protein